jgi:hypothetical protein
MCLEWKKSLSGAPRCRYWYRCWMGRGATGIRTREQNPLVSGVMWGTPSLSSPLDIRHEARTEDELTTFGWKRHDLRSFGEQTVLDGGLRIDTTFVKEAGHAARAAQHDNERGAGGSAGFGGSWAVRINASEAEVGALQRNKGYATVYWYLGHLQGETAAQLGVVGAAGVRLTVPHLVPSVQVPFLIFTCTCHHPLSNLIAPLSL